MKFSEIPDLCRKGYRPRVVGGKVTTLVPVPDGTPLEKVRSVVELVQANEVKIAEVEAKVDAEPVKP